MFSVDMWYIVICYYSEFLRKLLEHKRSKEMSSYTVVRRCNSSQTLFTRKTPTMREVLHGTVPGARSKVAVRPAGRALMKKSDAVSMPLLTLRCESPSPVWIYSHPRPRLRKERVLATLPYRCRCIQCWPELYSSPYELEDIENGEKNAKDESGCG